VTSKKKMTPKWQLQAWPVGKRFGKNEKGGTNRLHLFRRDYDTLTAAIRAAPQIRRRVPRCADRDHRVRESGLGVVRDRDLEGVLVPVRRSPRPQGDGQWICPPLRRSPTRPGPSTGPSPGKARTGHGQYFAACSQARLSAGRPQPRRCEALLDPRPLAGRARTGPSSSRQSRRGRQPGTNMRPAAES
jgi:hypothetical protein